LALGVARCVVAVVVEPSLAHSHRGQIGEAREGGRVGVARVVRVDAEDRFEALQLGAELDHLVPRRRRGADLEDPIDARRAGPLDQLEGWVCARVKVRVGVDHAAAAGASTGGKGGAAWSIPPAGGGRPAAPSAQPRSSDCPRARRICGAVFGRYDERATARTRKPSASAWSTWSSSAASASSFASSHGFRSVTNLFRARTKSQITSSAPGGPTSSSGGGAA